MELAMRILESLDQNARLTAKDLAVMLGEDEAKVAAEIKRLEEELVICGYPTLIDWDKTDKHQVTAMIEVKVTPQRGKGFDEIAERIYQFDKANQFRSSRRAQGTWYKYVVDLSSYGGEGYVAIRHYGCSDEFLLDVDDITIDDVVSDTAPVDLRVTPPAGLVTEDWTFAGYFYDGEDATTLR